jgi:hypothetical protein
LEGEPLVLDFSLAMEQVRRMLESYVYYGWRETYWYLTSA